MLRYSAAMRGYWRYYAIMFLQHRFTPLMPPVRRLSRASYARCHVMFVTRLYYILRDDMVKADAADDDYVDMLILLRRAYAKIAADIPREV